MRSPLSLRNWRARARPLLAARAKPRRPAARKLSLEPLEDRCLPSANIVFEWTDLLLDVGRLRSQNNAVASRAVAIMEAAIYDSVNAIDHAYTVYHVDATAFPGASTASAEAAAAQAAHDVAVGLFTQQADIDRFNATLDADLAAIPDSQAKTDGILLGQYVASQILDWRANDGSNKVVSYTIGTEPGDWQPTPPDFKKTPSNTQWPGVTSFALTSGDQFRPGPPPELTSADYTKAFQQIEPLGGNGTTTPSTRTPEQTEIAVFWAGIGATNAGVAIWNQIAETVAAAHGNTLAQNARLFALLNVSIADSYIAGFDAKYTYNYWRPVTAIRAADTDGNPDTSPDPTWTPLITTPNHPSYVALHACQSETAAQALASFFGTDHVSFTATWAGVERSFNKFTAAAHEAGMSRIYGGIHWSFDVAAGWHLGRNIGQYVAANFFLPVTSSVTATSVQSGGQGNHSHARSDAAAIPTSGAIGTTPLGGTSFTPVPANVPLDDAVWASPDSPLVSANQGPGSAVPAADHAVANEVLDRIFADIDGGVLTDRLGTDLHALLSR